MCLYYLKTATAQKSSQEKGVKSKKSRLCSDGIIYENNLF